MKNSYNQRNVEYEKIHSLHEDDIYRYINLEQIKKGDKILEHGCGYAPISSKILKDTGHDGQNIYLQDTSSFQLGRAKDKLSNYSVHYFNSSLKDCGFENDFFDLIYSKIVLQEMPLQMQELEIEEMIRIAKLSGKIVFWLWWIFPHELNFIRHVILQKDRIAGLKSMVENRYFGSSKEYLSIFGQLANSYKRITYELLKPIEYHTASQLEGDFRYDHQKLAHFNSKVLEFIDKDNPEIIDSLGFKVSNNDISFRVNQMMVIIEK